CSNGSHQGSDPAPIEEAPLRKLLALTFVGLLAVSSAASQEPTLFYTSTDYGDKVAFDVSIAWNDAQTAASSFVLEATALTGAISQIRAFGAVDLNTYQEAVFFTGVPGSQYDKNLDSWWYGGAGTSFVVAKPPYDGVDRPSGVPGQSTYRASFATEFQA